jgi:hypothetical protein
MKITPSTLKQLWLILLIEILTVPVVMGFFKFVEPKKLAAILAGSIFIITGLFILRVCRLWPDAFASFTYWMIHVHLFVFSIPMLVARAAFWNKNFEEIRFVFFSGPQFHNLAEKSYSLLMFATILDIVVHSVKAYRQRTK